MPKTLKQKKAYCAKPFKINIYNAKIRKNNSKFERVINLNDHESNNNNDLNVTKPTFPPTLTTTDLISKIKCTSNSSKAKTFPNAFIAYRIAFIKEYRNKDIKLPTMCNLSSIAKNSWNGEPQNVKDFYIKLSEDAKTLYKQKSIQIMFDKNMNKVKNNQESEQVSHLHTTSVNSEKDPDCVDNNNQRTERFSPLEDVQDSSSGELPLEASHNYKFFEDPYGTNSADRELFHLLDYNFNN
ncbi:17130_t:CDS:1 [Funneliformis geosporum]|uniref:2022_t:CDS:1 n=1 Tax=Funneliformis geosporum TaxID=1117311 RepID=A0A9W4WJI6_9GLOM|nr:17130_t:CDS:1 [Funneliformis geosporum]CAI2166515.1 2022_t:CDS:1 [Funneliformis geosporum]